MVEYAPSCYPRYAREFAVEVLTRDAAGGHESRDHAIEGDGSIGTFITFVNERLVDSTVPG